MVKQKKRIEVLTPVITSSEDNVSFVDLLSCATGKRKYIDIKSIELKMLTTSIENCRTGIVISCQNKDLPPKRNNQTGEFSAIGLNTKIESLSYGNIFFYDEVLNVLLYEVNLNGCDPDKFGDLLVEAWEKENEDNRISIKFTTVVRQAEYERAMRMGFYKEFYAELTCPLEIAQKYRDETSTLYKLARSYVNDAVKSNSDTIIVRMSSFGKKGKDEGLNIKFIKKLIDSFHFLQLGTQNKNVTQLRVKGYFTDPNEPATIQPVNLVADTFQQFIRLELVQQNTNLKEGERRAEVEKVYISILPELKRILNRER